MLLKRPNQIRCATAKWNPQSLKVPSALQVTHMQASDLPYSICDISDLVPAWTNPFPCTFGPLRIRRSKHTKIRSKSPPPHFSCPPISRNVLLQGSFVAADGPLNRPDDLLPLLFSSLCITGYNCVRSLAVSGRPWGYFLILTFCQSAEDF